MVIVIIVIIIIKVIVIRVLVNHSHRHLTSNFPTFDNKKCPIMLQIKKTKCLWQKEKEKHDTIYSMAMCPFVLPTYEILLLILQTFQNSRDTHDAILGSVLAVCQQERA